MITVTDKELSDLEEICTFIFNNDSNNKIEAGKIKNTTSKQKVAKILGISEGTLNNNHSNNKISGLCLKKFGRKLNIIKLVKDQQENPKSEYNRGLALMEKLENKNTVSVKNASAEIINQFKNSNWYCYEVHSKGVIEKKVIKFGNFVIDKENVISQEKLDMVIMTKSNELQEYKAEAFTNETGNILFIQPPSPRKANSISASYLFNLDNQIKQIELCIGNLTYEDKFSHKISSKIVILEKIGTEEQYETKIYNEDDSSIYYVKKEYRNILLNSNSINLITNNEKIISNPAMLKKLIDEDLKEKRNNRNVFLIGDYRVYSHTSMKGEKKSNIDILLISENEEGDLEAVFHDTKGDRRFIQEWVGKVQYNGIKKAAYIIMEGKISKNLGLKFIILNVPAIDQGFDVLTGILFGVQGDYNQSYCLRILATKNKVDLDYLPDYNAPNRIIHDFFDAFKFHSLLTSPIFPVTDFINIKNSIVEGDQLISHLKKVLKLGDEQL